MLHPHLYSLPIGSQTLQCLRRGQRHHQKVITVTNESYINAESICLMLLKIDALGLDVPITVVLDNARYQKCKVVFALAQAFNIELLYLPSHLAEPVPILLI